MYISVNINIDISININRNRSININILVNYDDAMKSVGILTFMMLEYEDDNRNPKDDLYKLSNHQK